MNENLPNTNGPNLVNVAAAFGFKIFKGKTIDIKILIRCTGEKFNVFKFPITMKISDLKGLLEFVCGIPYNLQRLSYLDDGELIDTKELQYYDLIDGALIIMDIWTIYVGLVQASVSGDFESTLNQGVSTRVEWKSPTHDYMYKQHKLKYINERSGISLFIASHRGNMNLVRGLISHGAQINYQSSYGRTPVMVAVVANKTDVIDCLLENNADIDLSDLNGDLPLTISKKFNNKLGTHKLAQFKWKKRTEAEAKSKKKIPKEEENVFDTSLFPHQKYDSSKKTWLKGDFMQVYMMQVVPESEFSGGGISAPKSVGKEVLRKHLLSRSATELKIRVPTEEDENGDMVPVETGLTYQKWLAQKEKAKRMLAQKKRKDSQNKTNNQEKKEESIKEIKPLTSNKEENTWMKDYLKNNSSKVEKEGYIETSITNFSSPSNSRLRITEIPHVYKGMSYDEWTKTRDKFMESHNLF